MIITILQALYFMLPAYMANMAPVLVKGLSWGNFPLDHGKTWRGQKIFGEHKTYRGLVAGTIIGVITIFVQREVGALSFFREISLLPYLEFSSKKLLFIGFALSFGALLGDLIKSFFKRRLGIASGKLWFPFDQLDFVIGSVVLIQILYTPPMPHLLIIIIFTPLLHFLINVIAYFLRLKTVWW